MKTIFLLIFFFPIVSFAHPGGLDEQGGHFDRKTNTYHCHEEPCFSIHRQVEEATQKAESRTFSSVYNRDNWPHWIDEDNDCQNLRQELLVATSMVEVEFTSSNRCTVKTGQWYGVYTGQIFTKASDVDIDHVVPLAHAHRHGADNWTREQRRTFANDPDNLLIVDDGTNQSKSDQAPHEWLPPNENYWCEYGKRWEQVKNKYNLRYSQQEHITLNQLANTCAGLGTIN
jgi:Protein of unknown function (DUF1524)